MSNTPVRLYKKQEDTMFERLFQWIERFALRYAHILLPIALILALALFVALCFILCGASATDSGVVYNQFNNTI